VQRLVSQELQSLVKLELEGSHLQDYKLLQQLQVLLQMVSLLIKGLESLLMLMLVILYLGVSNLVRKKLRFFQVKLLWLSLKLKIEVTEMLPG